MCRHTHRNCCVLDHLEKSVSCSGLQSKSNGFWKPLCKPYLSPWFFWYLGENTLVTPCVLRVRTIRLSKFPLSFPASMIWTYSHWKFTLFPSVVSNVSSAIFSSLENVLGILFSLCSNLLGLFIHYLLMPKMSWAPSFRQWSYQVKKDTAPDLEMVHSPHRRQPSRPLLRSVMLCNEKQKSWEQRKIFNSLQGKVLRRIQYEQ